MAAPPLFLPLTVSLSVSLSLCVNLLQKTHVNYLGASVKMQPLQISRCRQATTAAAETAATTTETTTVAFTFHKLHEKRANNS